MTGKISEMTARGALPISSAFVPVVINGDSTNYRYDLGAALASGVSLSALLVAISAAGSAANKLAYYTGTDAVSLTTFTAYGRQLVATVAEDDAQGLLGLGDLAIQDRINVTITGGSISGVTLNGLVTDLAIEDGGTAASTAAGARTNLGLGTSATLNVDTDGGMAANSDTVIASQKATVTKITDAISLVSAQIPKLNGLVSGGEVVWESGLTFRASAAVYYIDGTRYTSIEQTVTLDAAHATLDRIDVIVLNTSGTLTNVTGTASATPSEPDIDPATQLKLKFVIVPAAASAPSGVSTENVYLENTEWTSSTSGSGFNANSSSNPRTGTKDIEGTTVANAAYVQLQRSAPETLDTVSTLSLFIRSKAAWASGRVLRLQFYSAGVAKGQAVTLASGFWGFDSSITGSYQFVAIPMGNFVLPAGTSINQLRITDSGGSIGFYIDDIKLNTVGSSVGGGTGSGITQAQADARYFQRANNLSEGTAATMRTSLGLGTAAVKATGTSGNTVPLLDGANTWSAAQTDSGLATFSAGANMTPAATPATNAVGYLGAPINTQNGNYTFVQADNGKCVYHTSGSTHTWTIDSNANLAIPIGAMIGLSNESGGGNVTIAITSDTLRWGSSTGSRTLAANGEATLHKKTATSWRLTGDGIT